MKAENKGFIISLLLVTPLLVFAQHDTDKINFIRAQYSDINANLKLYSKKVKEDTAESAEGNEVTLFFKGNTIKKISAVYYGETGKMLQEFYFFEKKLIFYYLEEDRYNFPIYVNNGKVKITSKKEKRYYLNNDKIFLTKCYPKENVSPLELGALSIDIEKEANRLLHIE